MNNRTVVEIGLAAVAVGYGAYLTYRQNRVDRLLDEAVEEIANGIDVEVPESMIERAVEKVVERKTIVAMDSAVTRIVKDGSKDVKTEVDSQVKKSKEECKSLVKAEMLKQVGDIDIEDIRAEVVAEAREKAVSKLDTKLDGIVTEFTGNLASVKKIYDKVATSMEGIK